MSEENKNQMLYLSAFSILKRLLENSQIDRKTFEKANKFLAKSKGCEMLVA